MNRLITDCPEVLFAFVWTFFFCVSFVFYCITKEIKDSRNIRIRKNRTPKEIGNKEIGGENNDKKEDILSVGSCAYFKRLCRGISRKRKGKSIYEYLEEPCKVCKSNGFLLKRSYIENLIRNEIIKCSNENSINDFYVEIDKNYEEVSRC